VGAGTTRRGLTVSVGQSYASSQKGISAFQRGKYEDALKHLEPAAEKGDPEALYYLGRMYGAGQGVPKDQNKATAYAGHVSRFMTRAQQREARKKALAWQKAHEEKKPASN